jgi:hypothetical protein
MSITAELRWPARLNWRGRYLFLKGKPLPIDRETAAILDEDDRFKVRGLGVEAAPAAPKGKLSIKGNPDKEPKAADAPAGEQPSNAVTV